MRSASREDRWSTVSRISITLPEMLMWTLSLLWMGQFRSRGKNRNRAHRSDYVTLLGKCQISGAGNLYGPKAWKYIDDEVKLVYEPYVLGANSGRDGGMKVWRKQPSQ